MCVHLFKIYYRVDNKPGMLVVDHSLYGDRAVSYLFWP